MASAHIVPANVARSPRRRVRVLGEPGKRHVVRAAAVVDQQQAFEVTPSGVWDILDHELLHFAGRVRIGMLRKREAGPGQSARAVKAEKAARLRLLPPRT